MKIRRLEKRDYIELVQLFEELGYPTTYEEILDRFEKINKHEEYTSLVAVLNDKVVGFSGLCKLYYFEMAGTYTRILAFVISSEVRKQGIGTRLLLASEKWAKEEGCIGIALNSGNRQEREVAHLFYKANGYQAKSTGFSKVISIWYKEDSVSE